MPSQLEPALEERFGELLEQLRATHVEPSTELRERVQLMGRLEQPAPRRPLFRRRVVALAFAAALLVGAVAVGVAQRGGERQQVAEEGAVTLKSAQDSSAGGGAESAPLSTARAQDFRAQLTVRVDEADDLPAATRRAMQLVQNLGGYVVSAQYSGGDTDSVMVVRVPIARAQDAITRLAGLGELAAQSYSLQDLQSTIDQLDAQADRLRARIAELEEELQNPNLTPRERANLRAELDQAQRDLEAILDQRDGTAAQGRMAEITLTLTADRVAPSSSESVIDRAIGSLKDIWEWVLAVLIIAVPFVVLLAAAYWVGRRMRRRANERLLES
jgi:Domain of unknown function (DUF4349)